MRHFTASDDFSAEMSDKLLGLASDILKNPADYSDRCRGKILATLFYEPSTRTRLSFESAIMRLGGQALGFAGIESSSVSKGETMADTVRIVSSYADICAIRHNLEGGPKTASLYSRIPVINAGDGGHEHPTQTLADLLTLLEYRGRIDGLTIGMCGDLKYGRTVHSLARALSRYSDIKFVFICPQELEMPAYITDELVSKGFSVEVSRSLEQNLPNLDVLYMTRIQKERFDIPEDYDRLKDSYLLDPQKLTAAKSDLIVMHPLPRVGEIHPDVDADSRAKYFDQARLAVYVRMALILTLLESTSESDAKPLPPSGAPCRNPKCISTHEPLPAYKTPEDSCLYCGAQ